MRENFDLRPAGIIKMFDLRRPIYKQTAAYGHFGRTDIDLPWEKTRQGGCTESISVRVSCCFIKSLEMFMGALVRSTRFCAMIRITFR